MANTAKAMTTSTMSKRWKRFGDYVVWQSLGKGNFAKVFLAKHRITQTLAALKVIDTSAIKEEYVKRTLYREAVILRKISHPNILVLYEAFQISVYCCLATEYVDGGDFMRYLGNQPKSRFSEEMGRFFATQILSALEYLHRHGIVHRDLKMENIMIDRWKTRIKIIDFGLSNMITTNAKLRTHCGSPEYAAPELFLSTTIYGPEVDMWSLGVIFYAILVGKLPFTLPPGTRNRRQQLKQQIQGGLTPEHASAMVHLSEEAISLLFCLILLSPEARLTAQETMRHSWFGFNCKPFVNPMSTLMKILRLHPTRADELLRTSDCGFVSGGSEVGCSGISRVKSIRRCLEVNAEKLRHQKLEADFSQTIVDEICRLSGKTRDDVIFELKVEENVAPWEDGPPNYGLGHLPPEVTLKSILTSRNYYLMLKDEMEKASLQRLLGDAAPWISSRSAGSEGVMNSENGVTKNGADRMVGSCAVTSEGNGAERISGSQIVGNGISAVVRRRGSASPSGEKSSLSAPWRQAGSRSSVAGGGRSAWEKQVEDTSSQPITEKLDVRNVSSSSSKSSSTTDAKRAANSIKYNKSGRISGAKKIHDIEENNRNIALEKSVETANDRDVKSPKMTSPHPTPKFDWRRTEASRNSHDSTATPSVDKSSNHKRTNSAVTGSVMPSGTSVNESFFRSREKTVGEALSEARNLFAGIKGDSPEISRQNNSDRRTNEHRFVRKTKEDHSKETNDFFESGRISERRPTKEYLPIRETKDDVHNDHGHPSKHSHSGNESSPRRSTNQTKVEIEISATNPIRTDGARPAKSVDSNVNFRWDDEANVRTNEDLEVRNGPVSAKPGNDAGGDRLAVRTEEDDDVVKVRRKMSFPENEIPGDEEEEDRTSLPRRRRLPNFTVANDRGKRDVEEEEGENGHVQDEEEDEEEEEERSSENNLSDDQKIMTLRKPEVGVDGFDNVERRDAARSEENATGVLDRSRSSEGRSEKRPTRRKSNAERQSPAGKGSVSRPSSKKHGRESPQRSKELVEDLEPQQQQQQQQRRSLVDQRCDVISVDEMTSWKKERRNTVLTAGSMTCRSESPSKSAVMTEALKVSSSSRSTSMCGHVRKEDSNSPMKDAATSMVSATPPETGLSTEPRQQWDQLSIRLAKHRAGKLTKPSASATTPRPTTFAAVTNTAGLKTVTSSSNASKIPKKLVASTTKNPSVNCAKSSDEGARSKLPRPSTTSRPTSGRPPSSGARTTTGALTSRATHSSDTTVPKSKNFVSTGTTTKLVPTPTVKTPKSTSVARTSSAAAAKTTIARTTTVTAKPKTCPKSQTPKTKNCMDESAKYLSPRSATGTLVSAGRSGGRKVDCSRPISSTPRVERGVRVASSPGGRVTRASKELTRKGGGGGGGGGSLEWRGSRVSLRRIIPGAPSRPDFKPSWEKYPALRFFTDPGNIDP